MPIDFVVDDQTRNTAVLRLPDGATLWEQRKVTGGLDWGVRPANERHRFTVLAADALGVLRHAQGETAVPRELLASGEDLALRERHKQIATKHDGVALASGQTLLNEPLLTTHQGLA